MAQTKPKAGQFYGVSNNGTDGQFLKTDGTGGMSWDSPITNPTLTSIDYPGTAIAADPAGGESVIINGTEFITGITCTVGGTSVNTTLNSATQITITSPAKVAGQYAVSVTNTNGGSVTENNFIQYSGVPIWSTASGSLGSVEEGASASFQVTATEGSDTIEYAVTTGSLPSGLSLNTNTGAITGTAPTVSADTTTTFGITATDDENQTSSERTFSITVTNVSAVNFVKTVEYTGNSTGSYPVTTSQTIAIGFDPDLTITKGNAARAWVVCDTLRGDGEYMYLNTGSGTGNTGNNTYPGGTLFPGSGNITQYDDSAGNYGVNYPSVSHQVLCFKAGGAPTTTNSGGQTPTSGSKMIDGTASTTNFATSTSYPTKQSINTTLDFSITQITKSGTGIPLQVPHGLSGAPEFIMLKIYNTTEDWVIWHKDIGNQYYLSTNRTGGGTSAGEEGKASSSNAFSIVNGDIIQNQWTNAVQDWMCYAWKSVAGFSDFGSYSGTGNKITGPVLETGFKPSWVMIKRTDANGYNWSVYTKHSSYNTSTSVLWYANQSTTPATDYPILWLENGFEIKDTSGNVNASGGTYVYAAFADAPDTTTPSLSSSFGTDLYVGPGTPITVTTGFEQSLIWNKCRNFSASWRDTDQVRGGGEEIYCNDSAAQAADNNGITLFGPTSYNILGNWGGNFNNQNFVSYTWKGENKYPTANFQDALAVYKWNDNATDVTGNYDATATDVSYTSGKFGQCVVSGASSASELNLNMTQSHTAPFSWSFWFYATANSGIDNLIAAGNGINVGLEINKVFLFTAGSNRGSGTSISLNTWNHYVVTFDGSSGFKTYVNGSLAESITQTPPSGGAVKMIKSPYGSWGPLEGRLDQTRIYNRVLSAGNVSTLYNETVSDNDSLTYGSPVNSITSANQAAGFSIVKWTGTGVAADRVKHGLNGAPDWILYKDLSNTRNWNVYVGELDPAVASTYKPYGGTLDLDIAFNTGGGTNGSAGTPDATTIGFTAGSSTVNNVNALGAGMIAYCFKSVANFCKAGYYTGTGGANTINVGFAPTMIIFKKYDGTGAWRVFDTARGTNCSLRLNSGDPEYVDGSNYVDFTSTGFEFSASQGNTDLNGNGSKYCYLAFKDNT